ncbi:MAG: 1-acyl-sn-glycerol-3-phosphate acyltransferase [Prevotellaceae bacterium]|nr:1-acyl-sn-glycerol-3-phosphate acyltransferase [Prevotellaceae bacterium]
MEYNFDDIRPFYDSEIGAELAVLSREPQLLFSLKQIYPRKSTRSIIKIMSAFRTVKEFQVTIIRALLKGVAAKTTAGISIAGLEQIADSPNRLFISNHRDIILDSAFLNVLLLDGGRETCEICIGDNLFIAPWVEKLVRINKSIVVRRNLPVRQVLEASAKLSAYIRFSVTELKNSIWIAQREGRAKDADDRTQDAVLKMFNISGSGNVLENMRQLNITPIGISYEYDPCDYLKAKEFQQKRDNPDFKKSPEDDSKNMVTGLWGWKGRVHYEVSPLSMDIAHIAEGSKNEQISALSKLIDRHIHRSYKIYPINIIAFDLLQGNVSAEKYTQEEKNKFEKYLQSRIEKVDLANKDEAFLRHKILEMYANPYINYLKAREPHAR